MSDVYLCEITNITTLADAVYSMTVVGSDIAVQAKPGQFLHIKCGHSRLLRRPISISSVCDDKVTIVFEAKGEGTKWLAKRSIGQKLNVLGPLGNGFVMPDGKLIVVGGGVGTPPMLYAAQAAKNGATAILGFRSADRVILKNEFEKICDKVYITTDDGSDGIHGAVTKPLEELLKTGDYEAVMSCGQLLMQKAVAQLCARYNTDCQVSLEERMGCGVGACLVCACATYINNSPDSLQMSRACIDGPVFNSNEVVWNTTEGVS